MKKSLFYFNNLCNKISTLILEDTEKNTDSLKPSDVNITTDTEVTATVNNKPVKVTVSEENINNSENILNEIVTLQEKLSAQLEEIKKKAYASRLYSTKVGNNPNALKDYGYFLGQKDLLYSILKDLSLINQNNLQKDIQNESDI